MKPFTPMIAAAVILAGVAHAQVSPQQIKAIWHKLPRPRVAVAPTPRPPAIDGKIDVEEWAAGSKLTDLIGIEAPRWKGIGGFDLVTAQTAVWVTYDKKSLYVAFRCEEPEIETLVVKKQKVPRDGSLWWDDCVELFLSPTNSEAHCHFIINSKAGIYDAKNAPGEKRGSGWNLEGLKVAAWVSPPGKGSHWSVEMAVPFAGLGVAAPKPGEAWGINFGRERWAPLYKNVAELSTWSSLVGGFQQPKMFGEICFTDVRQDIRLPRPFLGPIELAAELTTRSARKLTLEVRTASARGVVEAGSASAALPAGKPATVKGQANVKTEGVQFLALLIQDAETGKLLSCSRVPFYIPDVLTAAARVKTRLAKLAGKAENGTDLEKSTLLQAATVEATVIEAHALLASFHREAPDEGGRKQWHALHDRMATIEAATTYAVWTCSPYIATGPSSMPPALGKPPTLRMEAAQNEYEHAVLNVTNLTKTAIEFWLDGRLPGQVGRPRSGLNTTVQKLARFQPRLLGKKLSDLPEEEDGLAVPLVELNGLGTFFVQPFSTRQIWLTVQTRDLRPGTTRHALRIVPLSLPLPATSVPVEMTVWPFKIEDEAPIGVFCFDYAGDYEWLKSHKINLWFRGAFPPASKGNLELDAHANLKPYKTDIDRVKRRMAEGARRFLFSYGYTGSFIQWAQRHKIKYMSEQWRRLFKQILSRMIKEWLDAGLRYDDFALQTIDEAHGQQVQQVIETTPLMREVDPKVRTAMTIMTDLDDLKRMAPHVDVWINRNGAMWGKAQWDFFHSEQAKGKPIWSWNMPCTPKSKPLTQFRTYGWRAMKFDFDAIGFFNYFGMVYLPQRRGGGIRRGGLPDPLDAPRGDPQGPRARRREGEAQAGTRAPRHGGR